MPYTIEQYEKHKEYVNQEMNGYTHEQKQAVIGNLRYIWPTDGQLEDIVLKQKAEFDSQVHPDSAEIDEIMKNIM